MNLNKVNLIGRVTKDPEKRVLPSGSSVVKIGVATNHTFKKQDGSKTETTQFHNCVAFGKVADIIAQYIIKGQEIYIGGRIEYRSWEKKDGTKAYATEIVVDDMQMGQRPGGARQAQSPADVVAQRAPADDLPTIQQDEFEASLMPPPASEQWSKQYDVSMQVSSEDINVEDIPF